MKKIFSFLIVLSTLSVFGQNDVIIPVTINEKFSDFILVNDSGEKISSKELKGKKLMLVFIRGRVTETLWCPICHYQYLELVNIDKNRKLRKKHNLEIFFVLPYSRDSLSSWKSAFNQSINIVENWKYPKNESEISEGQKEWMNYCREFFPQSFKVESDKLDLSIPILFDEDQKVSEGLLIYTKEWGGTKVEQNIPTIFILDEEGYVKYKYHSQYTNDRPNADYLNEYLEKMF